MLEFVKGDLFDVKADIRVNTVNCVGVMGAGVALAFKQRYPEMFRDYRYDCKSGAIRPGKMHIWKSLSGDWVINFPTKRDWREPSRYEDIDAGLIDLREYLDSVGPVSVALPALGCGHGGLDWSRVSGMIRERLDGVQAHVFVFEPAASHRAGKSQETPTDDERRSAEQLGYQVLERSTWIGKAQEPAYVLGSKRSLERRWIALLPSREPGERELFALEAIATELAQSKGGVTVAMTYATKATEQVADLFARRGIATVLLLPFGVLTRKALAKKSANEAANSTTVVSFAPPNMKWSRQLFAQTVDLLRARAEAVLFSDPEPDWLANKVLDKWSQISMSYIRYGKTAPHLQDALSKFDAKPVGRRGENGAPNLDHLLAAFSKLSGETPSDEQKTEKPDSGPIVSNPGSQKSGTPEKMLSFSFEGLSDDERRSLINAMLHLDISRGTLLLNLPADFSELDHEKLIALGFREEPVAIKRSVHDEACDQVAASIIQS